MRDKNLSYLKFNIQLEKTLEKDNFFRRFLRRAVIDSPTSLEDYRISYPRDFRLLRSLSIIQWYLPEILHWRILLDLQDMGLTQLNSKQRIEIQILLYSKEVCSKFLYETKRYSSYELFGNILKNDIIDLEKIIKFSRKNFKLKKSKRKRGYDDHGSLKPSWKWLPISDFSFTEYQNQKERKQYLELKTINYLIKYLEKISLLE